MFSPKLNQVLLQAASAALVAQTLYDASQPDADYATIGFFILYAVPAITSAVALWSSLKEQARKEGSPLKTGEDSPAAEQTLSNLNSLIFGSSLSCSLGNSTPATMSASIAVQVLATILAYTRSNNPESERPIYDTFAPFFAKTCDNVIGTDYASNFASTHSA